MADFLGTTTMAALQSGYWLKYIVIYMIQCMVRRKTISLFFCKFELENMTIWNLACI